MRILLPDEISWKLMTTMMMNEVGRKTWNEFRRNIFDEIWMNFFHTKSFFKTFFQNSFLNLFWTTSAVDNYDDSVLNKFSLIFIKNKSMIEEKNRRRVSSFFRRFDPKTEQLCFGWQPSPNFECERTLTEPDVFVDVDAMHKFIPLPMTWAQSACASSASERESVRACVCVRAWERLRER